MKWIKSGIFILVIISVITAAPMPLEADSSKVLPKTSVPFHYDLNLSLSAIGTSTVKGVVTIEIEIMEDTETLTLHNRGLAIDNITLTASGTELEQEHELEADKDFMHIKVLSRQLLKGEKVSAEITFTGSLQTNLFGIYRTSYKVNDSTR